MTNKPDVSAEVAKNLWETIKILGLINDRLALKAINEALLVNAAQPVAVQEATEPESEYDRMKRQKDTILLGERLKHCTCDECGASKADGWALYCVSCSEILRTTDDQAKITVEQIEKAELRLLLNRRRTNSLEGDPNFYDGVRWAESICTSTAPAAPTDPLKATAGDMEIYRSIAQQAAPKAGRTCADAEAKKE